LKPDYVFYLNVYRSNAIVVRILLYLVALIFLVPELVNADPAVAAVGDSHFMGDLETYLTSPFHWDSSDWSKLGMIAGGLYIASETLDDYWKDEMINESHPLYYKSIDNIGDAWGDGRLSGPFILGVYGLGLYTRNDRYVNASQSMLQSVVYTGIMTQVLKHVFRRNRPNAAADEAGWFGGGVSFPSGHTSTAFAISRSFLNSLDHPNLGQQVLFYGLAASTALARTYDNAHWVTDTIAGALLGIYTADYVSAKNSARRNKRRILPYMDGRTIGFQMQW